MNVLKALYINAFHGKCATDFLKKKNFETFEIPIHERRLSLAELKSYASKEIENRLGIHQPAAKISDLFETRMTLPLITHNL